MTKFFVPSIHAIFQCNTHTHRVPKHVGWGTIHRIMQLSLLLFITITLPAHAITTELPIEDPAAEQRAIELFKTIRCQVCQGEAIYDSRATLARDLRFLIRTHIQQGKTDQEIKDYLVSRYGQDVLMETPMHGLAWVLWIMPFLIVGISVWFIARRT